MAYNNMFILSQDDCSRIYEFVVSMLSDPQVEVRIERGKNNW